MAFVLGWLVGRQPVVVEPPSDPVPRTQQRDLRALRAWTPNQRVEALHRHAAVPFPRLEDRLEMERHMARLPLEEVKQLCTSEAGSFDDPFNEPSEGRSGNDILRNMAIEEWARRDPFGMIDSGINWYDQDLFRIVRAAALIDTDRARNLAIARSGPSGYSVRTGLLQGIADANPELAFAFSRELPHADFDYMDLDAIAEGFHDPLHKLEWADLVFERGGLTKQPAIYRILQMIAEDDPGLLEKSADRPVLRHFQTEVSGFIRRQRWRNIPVGDPVAAPTLEDWVSADEAFEERIERWFDKDPVAVGSWLDGMPDNDQRKSLAGLARAATMTDLHSLDRMMETFTSREDRETIQRCAISLLSDGNTSPRSALRAFVGKYPEARQYVRRPQILEP